MVWYGDARSRELTTACAPCSALIGVRDRARCDRARFDRDRSCSRIRIRWAGGCRPLEALLEGPLAGLFRASTCCRHFPSSGDRGFAPLTYYNIDPRFGGWEDIRRIGERYDVMLDLMINHISRQSPEFQDFERQGRRSPTPTCSSPSTRCGPMATHHAPTSSGSSCASPIRHSRRSRSARPASSERVWTSFGSADWSEQVDLDVTSPATGSSSRSGCGSLPHRTFGSSGWTRSATW